MAERISHANCDHPSTTAARTVCRRNQQKVANGKIKDTPATRALQKSLTENYRETLLALADLTVDEVKGLVKDVDLEDIDLWFKKTMPDLLSVIEANHKDAGLLTVQYLRQHAALQGFKAGAVPAKAIREQLIKSLEVTGPVAFKKHVATGASATDAVGVMKTTLSGSGERLAMAGARDTLDAAVGNPESDVLGYSRRTSSSPCDYCAGLSKEAVYDTNTFHAHDHCTCTGEPFYLDTQFARTQTVKQLADVQVKDSDTLSSVVNALEIISRVHRVSESTTKEYQVKFVDTEIRKLGGARGAFETKERTIRIDPKSPHIEFTTVHEFGHHLDWSMFSKKGKYWATQIAIGRVSPEFQKLFDLMKKSPEYKEWVEISKVPARAKYFKYVLYDQEVFARAYTQWIATRSQSAELLQALKKDIPTAAIHWDAKSFEPIAEEFDRIFRERGLLL